MDILKMISEQLNNEENLKKLQKKPEHNQIRLNRQHNLDYQQFFRLLGKMQQILKEQLLYQRPWKIIKVIMFLM